MLTLETRKAINNLHVEIIRNFTIQEVKILRLKPLLERSQRRFGEDGCYEPQEARGTAVP